MAEATSSNLYVARDADLAVLKDHWAAARKGEPRFVRLHAPLGGGKRAMVGELARGVAAEDEGAILWRVALSDEQDGVNTLIRLYAGLLQTLHRSPGLRGKVEMTLNSALPTQPQRVQRWYQAFIEGLKNGAPKPGETEFQVIMPRDNPLIGLVEIALGIARKHPVLLEVQGLTNCHSTGIFTLLEGLLDEALAEDDGELKLMAILSHDSFSEAGKAGVALPLLDMLDRRKDDLDELELGAWTGAEVALYAASKGVEIAGNADHLARIAGGRPGFVAELIDWLGDKGRLTDDLSAVSLADIADVTPDADELESDGEPAEGGRPKATAADAEKCAHIAALLGLSFPSGMLADMAGLERDSVDDLLDATEGVYAELQFSQPLGTWIYQFHKALLRESVLARHTTDEDRALGARVASVLERVLVPRGYAYLTKTLRMYAEYGEANRASVLRSMALGADQPQMWAMTHDLVRYFDEVAWPDPLRRTVFMHLLDRMIKSGGDVNQADQLYNEAMKWATDKADRPMQAWLLFEGSQLDLRRQDLYRARDRANDALKLYKGLGDGFKVAEIEGHLAMIELNDGNTNAALDHVRAAEAAANVPPIQAQGEFVRGHVARRARKNDEAIEHFRRSNEIAGKAGIGQLALNSGLALGETLLVAGQGSKAADVLNQVVRIAQQLQAGVQERAAVSLLAQAQASLGNWEAAMTAGNRALELTRTLKFERFEPVDLYNLGFFHLMLKRPTEAVSLFRQSRQKASPQDRPFLKELLFNMGQALLEIGERTEGADALRASIGPASETRDWRKVMVANQRLAELAVERGDKTAAKTLYDAAVKAADAGGFKEDRKNLRRKADHL